MSRPGNDPVRWEGQAPQSQRGSDSSNDGTNLADILERVLDKGIVIAGDIQINLLDIELLTIKLRLVVASVDKAKEMGIDWWERDPTLSSGYSELEEENGRLRRRLESLEGAPALDGAEDGDEAEDGDGAAEDDGAGDDGAGDDADADAGGEAEPAPRERATRRRSTS